MIFEQLIFKLMSSSDPKCTASNLYHAGHHRLGDVINERLVQNYIQFQMVTVMEKEFIEILTLIKLSYFEGREFYIFMNEKGDFRSLESDKFQSVSLEPGAVVQAKMKKLGCSGREITELLLNTA